MSCPVVQTTAASPEIGSVGVTRSEFTDKEKYKASNLNDLFDGLRRETLEIEENIAIGQKEVLDRDQHAFLMRRHELSIAYVILLLRIVASRSCC